MRGQNIEQATRVQEKKRRWSNPHSEECCYTPGRCSPLIRENDHGTSQNRLPKVSPNSMLARVLLAFLASAGLYYVNIMPALVDGLKVGLGFSNKQAGLVGSCNVYGAACGAFLIVFLVRRINWRSAAHLLLLGLIGMDLLSMLVKNPFGLMGARFLHGFIGGMLIGISFSIFARTTAPDRTFGVLLLVQVFAGGLGVMSLPLLVPKFGTNVLFVAMILVQRYDISDAAVPARLSGKDASATRSRVPRPIDCN